MTPTIDELEAKIEGLRASLISLETLLHEEYRRGFAYPKLQNYYSAEVLATHSGNFVTLEYRPKVHSIKFIAPDLINASTERLRYLADDSANILARAMTAGVRQALTEACSLAMSAACAAGS